jgi:hypothetical protein
MMAVFLRGSADYAKVRRHGRQVLRSFRTVDTAFDTAPPVARQDYPPTCGTLEPAFFEYRDRVQQQGDHGHAGPSYLLDIIGLLNAHTRRFSGRSIEAQLAQAAISFQDHQALSVDRRRRRWLLASSKSRCGWCRWCRKVARRSSPDLTATQPAHFACRRLLLTPLLFARPHVRTVVSPRRFAARK